MKNHTKRKRPQAQFVTNDVPSPKRLSKRAKMKLAKHGKGFATQKADPSRTGPMVRAFQQKLAGQFALLKERMLKQVGEQDMLGLSVIQNSNPEGHNQYTNKSFKTSDELVEKQKKQWESSSLGVRFHEGIVMVPIGKIKGNTGDVEKGRLEKLKQVVDTATLPPVVARRPYSTEKPTLKVLDGNHRFLAAKANGHTHVPVLLVKSMADKQVGVDHDPLKDLIVNCQPGQLRGADGRCGPGVGLGIPRDDMPQIPADKIPQFIQWCRQQGVGISEEQTSVHEMQPVQQDFRQERVDAVPDEAMTQPIIVCKETETWNTNVANVVSQETMNQLSDSMILISPMDRSLAAPNVTHRTLSPPSKTSKHSSILQRNVNPNHDERGRFDDGDATSRKLTSEIKRWVRQSGKSPREINDEHCGVLSSDVMEKLGGDTEDLYESFTNSVSPGHVWMTYRGKHYDAEAPEGVTDRGDLPFFKRNPTVNQKSSSIHRILDGTHRWVKAWQEGTATLPVIALDLPVDEALQLMRRFTHVKFAANQGEHDEMHDLRRDQSGQATVQTSWEDVLVMPRNRRREGKKETHQNRCDVAQDDPRTLTWEERRQPTANDLSDVPDVQQRKNGCGPAAMKAAADSLGVVKSLSEWTRLLDTDEDGTSPAGMLQADGVFGLELEERHGMTVADLKELTADGELVLCPIQADGGVVDNSNPEGHNQYTGIGSSLSGVSKLLQRLGIGHKLNTEQQAADLLNKLPDHNAKDGSKFGSYKVPPFRVVASKPFSGQLLRDKERAGDFKTEQVDLDSLHTDQGYVAYNKVKKLISLYINPDDPKLHDLDTEVLVARVGGKQYLYEGHHRATAALLSGRKTIKARVVELPTVDPDASTVHNTKTNSSGHWVVVLEVRDGYVIVQDPSMSNILEDADHDVAASGKVMIEEEAWEKAWHDVDVDGKEYDHYGIVVNRAEVENSNPNHDELGRFASVPEVTHRDFEDSGWDQTHSGLGSKLVATKMAEGMKDVDKREYGIMQHASGKWQLVSKPEKVDSKKQENFGEKAFDKVDYGSLRPIEVKDVRKFFDSVKETFPSFKAKSFVVGGKVSYELNGHVNIEPGDAESNQKVVADMRSRDKLWEEVSTKEQPTLQDLTKRKDRVDLANKLEAGDYGWNNVSSVYVGENRLVGTVRHEVGHALHSHFSEQVKELTNGWDYHKEHFASILDESKEATYEKKNKELIDRYSINDQSKGSFGETVAENFSAYLSGHKDKVHPEFKKLLDKLSGRTVNHFFQEPLTNSVPNALDAFQAWLKRQLGQLIVGKTQEQMWDAYIQAGFKKGAGRAFDDVRKPYAKGYAADKSTTDFHNGSKEEFLRSSFGQPVAREKVKLMASRSFDEMENVTADMSNKLSRVLTDGLVEGKHPDDVAADMVEQVGFGRSRAEMVARTELIKVHAEGQLLAFEQLGVEELGVEVEFSDASDGLVCPECAELDGQTFSIDEAHGIIPVHPRCRCCFRPSGAALTGNLLVDDLRQRWPTNNMLDDLVRLDQLRITNQRNLVVNAFNLSERAHQLTLNAEEEGNCGTGVGGFQPGNTCAKGDGGETSKSDKQASVNPPASQHRIEQIKKEAAKIEVTDEVTGQEEVGERDYDEIEERMTGVERQEMDEHLETIKQESIDSQVDEADLDVDERGLAEENGMSADDVEEKANDMFKAHDLEAPSLRGRDWGVDGIQKCIDSLDADAPEELKEQLEEWKDEAEKKMDKLKEEEYERQQDQLREELENDYDDTDDKREYLREFHRDNEERFVGGDCPAGAWCKDSDGDGVYHFETSSGQSYKVAAVNRKVGNMTVPDMQFSDESGSYKVTGKGDALEVFARVVPAMVAYVQKKDLDVATFSAAEPSRQRLYDRLVKTVATVLPDYFAAATHKNGGKYYIIGKRGLKEHLMELAKSGLHLPSDQAMEMIVNSKVLPSEVDDNWWTESAWGNVDDA